MTSDSLSILYLDAVRTLHKAQGTQPPRALLRGINSAHDATEPKAVRALTAALKRARTRMRRKVTPDKLAGWLETVHKADEDNVRAKLREILDTAFDGSAADLLAVETDLINKLASQFATVYDVELNFNLISAKAVDYLQNHADNYFSTLSDSQADGLFKVAADTLASDDQYTIRDVAKNILDSFLKDSLYYETDSGSRTIGSEEWAMITARTETARAASYAQKATLDSIGLKTWQWNVQATGCDDCQDNDGEIVTIGEPFPSGDTEAPAHPNCRCIVTAVMDELDSLGDDNSDE